MDTQTQVAYDKALRAAGNKNKYMYKGILM